MTLSVKPEEKDMPSVSEILREGWGRSSASGPQNLGVDIIISVLQDATPSQRLALRDLWDRLLYNMPDEPNFNKLDYLDANMCVKGQKMSLSFGVVAARVINGMNVDTLQQQFPGITQNHVIACLQHARDVKFWG